MEYGLVNSVKEEILRELDRDASKSEATSYARKQGDSRKVCESEMRSK